MPRIPVFLLPFLALGSAAPVRAAWDGAAWADYGPFLGTLSDPVRTNLRAIALAGRAQGREPGRLGQIGDSITESSAYFRNVVMNGETTNETGHDYAPIRSWLAYGGAQPADANSFYRDHGKGGSWGNKSGWKLPNAVTNGHPAAGVLTGDGTTPGNYAWVLIMFGTNDIDGGWNATAWQADLATFVQGYIDLGVVPVLSTIPPEQAHVADGRVDEANDAIRAVAADLQILCVDYHGLILHYQPKSWLGTLISGDGTHPTAGGGGTDFSQNGLTTTDGYAARTKLTLDVAEVLRDQVFDEAVAVERKSWGSIRGMYRGK